MSKFPCVSGEQVYGEITSRIVLSSSFFEAGRQVIEALFLSTIELHWHLFIVLLDLNLRGCAVSRHSSQLEYYLF